MITFLIVLLMILPNIIAEQKMVETGIFSYTKEEDWFSSQECQGNRQSPINITSCNIAENVRLFNFYGISYIPEWIQIINQGHTVMAELVYKMGQQPTITGGPLNTDIYEFSQFHFHWGSVNSRGSEHLINGKGGPMEIHLVFFNKKYLNFMNASTEPDGLSVIGFIYKLSPKGPFMEVAKHLQNIKNVNETYTIENKFPLKDVIGSERFSFYSYKGSLTTPPCSQNVIWIVPKTFLLLQQSDLDKFRTLKGYDGSLSDNFRKVQPLNGRQITCYNNRFLVVSKITDIM